MTLAVIGWMVAGALISWLFRANRANVLLALSVGALYLLQPTGFELALPTATIVLVLGVWWLTSKNADRNDTITLLLLTASAAFVVLFRAVIMSPQLAELGEFPPLTAAALTAIGAGAIIPKGNEEARRRIAFGFILLIVGLLVILKLPALHN